MAEEAAAPAALNNGEYIGEFAALLPDGTTVLHPLYSTVDIEDGSYDAYVGFESSDKKVTWRYVMLP